MKTLKPLIAIAVFAAACFGQSSPAFSFSQGYDPVSTKPCSDSANVGSIYTQIGQGGITSVCQQTGASSLGAGAFVWNTVIGGATVTTGGGSISVATGKTFTAANTLTLQGTDATTFTFPSASGNVVTTGATQTLTNKTLTAPVLGAATATSINKVTITAPATGSTLTIADGKTLTANNSIIFAGTDSTTVTFPSTSISVPGTVIQNCGTTSTCAATNVSATSKVVSGAAPLVSGTPSAVTITGISPAFTSTTSYACAVTNQTNAANSALKVVNTSASSITITGPDTLTDVIGYVCIGS